MRWFPVALLSPSALSEQRELPMEWLIVHDGVVESGTSWGAGEGGSGLCVILLSPYRREEAQDMGLQQMTVAPFP